MIKELSYNGYKRKVLILRENETHVLVLQLEGGSKSGGRLPFYRTFLKTKISE